MKKIKLSIFLMLLYSSLVNSQINDKSNNLVSSGAFNKLVFQDLNFMILGDAAPQQGLAFELNDDNTEIEASGYLGNKKNYFFTIDGEFTVDNGVYFFDENEGSKKSRFAFNTYIGLNKSKRSFYSMNGGNESIDTKIDDDKKKQYLSKKYNTRIAFIKKNLYLVDSVPSYFYRFKGFVEYMKKNDLTSIICKDEECSDIELYYAERIDTIQKSYKGYIKIDDKKTIKVDDTKYRLTTKAANRVLTVTDEKEENENYKKKDYVQKLPGDMNVLKLLEDYKSAKDALDDIVENTKDKELAIAQESWTSKKISFLGISPFYQRESTTLYEFRENTEFNKLFQDITGDVYGATVSYNYVWQRKGQKYLIFRGLVSASRSSNINQFKQQTITVDVPTGDVIGGVPITIANSKKGYIGDAAYTYGFRQSYDVELYYSNFIKYLGVFGNIGYNKLGFSEDSGIKDIEQFPLRLGLLLNLKSKDEEKNILTLQLFMDRQDLNKSPNGDDKDLRFGFKVGLPINISKKL
ncbi:hypothetical protein [Aquimarina sp. AU119]|uniref:hypothetical protein n=1 Tax=Aquimarina sp. AU119 TaxID=2108528 RepID=UPI001358C112|nr:hypothetical protein [Aquimarina sp. AU119]